LSFVGTVSISNVITWFMVCFHIKKKPTHGVGLVKINKNY
jgi:hypothetical protein